MSRRSDDNLSGLPMKPYDLLLEGFTVLGIVLVIVVVLASVFSSPDYPPVRAEDVARLQPVAYLKTSAGVLAGNGSTEDYGPPYTRGGRNAQHVAGVSPADWFGVTIPIDTSRDFVIRPLQRVGEMDTEVRKAVGVYESAGPKQQKAWSEAYLASLEKAKVVNGRVRIPRGDYGPVETMMGGMLRLGRAGLLEGALESGKGLPYTLNFTRSLLFFQDNVDHGVASDLDVLGEQWGISHETGPYPGAWWLWPYTFLYQIPPMSASPNGDLQVALIVTFVFIMMLFIPFIPVVNQLPRWVRVYRLIWRDWYRLTSD